MILCLLLAALLGFIIGYLFGKSTCASDDCGHTETPSHEETHAVSSDTQESVNNGDKPVLLSAPRNGEKDNLTRIKGIGVNIEESLNKVGIYHFDQIAAWNAENIAWADSTLGFPGRAEREQWVTQAKVLASGEETHVVSSDTQESVNNDDKPVLLSAPRNGEKDNLTRIKGIGVKIEESLNEIGIYHFDQIAAWNAENIAWADSTLGFPGRAEREQWVTQAKALAAGEETEFSKRVDAGEVSTSKQS
jgi:predicted flap endonuclease-1-like 5' DNA nuclease